MTHRIFTNLNKLVCVLFFLLPLPISRADNVHWVGDQTTEPNRFWTRTTSWGAGSFWEAFRPAGLDVNGQPKAGDVAIFDLQYDPSGAPLPGAHYETARGGTIHFGDFEYWFLNSSSSFRRFDAIDQQAVHPTPDILRVTNGDWTFDFGPHHVYQGESGSLTVGAQLLVGDAKDSDASLTVQNGHLHNGFVTHVAAGENSVGRVIVQGPDTLWTTDSYVDLGWVGDGTIRVQDGAKFNPAGVMWIGIDRHAEGSLEIFSGGKVQSPGGAVLGRDYSTSYGNVVVSGRDSLWETSGFAIGGAGRGNVRVANGGKIVVTGDIAMGLGDKADGKLRISSRGTVNAVNLRVGEQGTAAMVVETQGFANVANSLHIGSRGSVDVTGGGIINIGLGGLPDPGILRVGPEGLLSGKGTILGDVLIDGGVVSPGASPGALHIDGDYRQLSESVLRMEIAGTTPAVDYDQLLVSGALELDGDVEVSFLDSYLPRNGDRFDLFAGSSVNFLGDLKFLNAPANFQYNTVIRGGVLSLNVVPEPGTMFLGLVGVAASVIGRKRSN